MALSLLVGTGFRAWLRATRGNGMGGNSRAVFVRKAIASWVEIAGWVGNAESSEFGLGDLPGVQ